jgi:AcrR family transcriptional regulator
MVELVAEHGYDAVTVAMLTGRARISKRDFYRRFSGKEECFLATYDILVSRSVRGILAAAEGEGEWCERLRLGFLAFAGQIAADPEAARLALVEVFAAGAVAVERMLSTNRLFESLVAEILGLADETVRLPPLVVKGIVAGCSRVARARLISGCPQELELDGGELLEWALSFCDDSVGRLRELRIAGAAPAPGAVREASLGEVAPGDERALILTATVRLASREGYAMLTVPRIRVAAGVSQRSFESHFEGVPDCFLATVGTLSRRTLAAAEPSYLAADDWASGIHQMVTSLCAQLARDPGFASLAFLEVFSPDPEMIRWRSEMIAMLAEGLRRRAPRAGRPTVFAAEASVGAMWGVIYHFVAIGRGAELPTVAPVLSYLALAPALGGAAAVDAILAASPTSR